MAATSDRRKDTDNEDEESSVAWSAPRPSPGAMGAAHDDLFGVPSAGPREPDSDADDDVAAGDAETDVEGDAEEGRDTAAGDDDVDHRGAARRDQRVGRSIGAEETDVEGRSGGTTDPDGDGSRASSGTAND
jgi:hypothetical protein